jgi:hypothetical protein
MFEKAFELKKKSEPFERALESSKALYHLDGSSASNPSQKYWTESKSPTKVLPQANDDTSYAIQIHYGSGEKVDKSIKVRRRATQPKVEVEYEDIQATPVDKEYMYKCELCPLQFPNKGARKTHVRRVE